MKMMRESAMKIVLNAGLNKFVQQKVREGTYANASEVVQDALKLLKRNSNDVDLRREIMLGINELDRGESAPWDVEEIKAEGRRLLKKSGGRNQFLRRKGA
jgi:antitoxin ParD1/3/4